MHTTQGSGSTTATDATRLRPTIGKRFAKGTDGGQTLAATAEEPSTLPSKLGRSACVRQLESVVKLHYRLAESPPPLFFILQHTDLK